MTYVTEGGECLTLEKIPIRNGVASDTAAPPDLSPLGDNPSIDPNAPPDDKVYTFVEQMPEFPGGPGEILKFLGRYYHYPPCPMVPGTFPTNAKLRIRFIVDKTGAVRDPEIMQGFSSAHDAEALRVVRLLPRFRPGRQNGRPMNVYYMVPLSIEVK